ncbi:hypothetical protein M409DRAFT_17741 [Zasmidium cellare ATCC 36951]|uniref:F-box domain-containing protein n=1 Tax=Zasmidium cellare ATCC 36951 TaxID=1080233 RepID=A0A6A6D262_ZASCE|nr:uncharacterized protein M409DRAFT_17741 [Zasmidium cellare ATCC 36951]KAF2172508.1 hypothetical protein M409DRAFT_17741 [Zasmidium cellare ATCC 36951]
MELTQPADINTWHAKIALKIAKKLRSDKQYTQAAIDKKDKKESAKLQKRNRRPATAAPAVEANELGERIDYGPSFSDATTLASSRKYSKTEKDHGDMMHRLAHHDSFDSLLDKPYMKEQLRDPYFSSTDPQKMVERPRSEKDEARIASLPDELWERIASFMEPVDAANLAYSTKTLYKKLLGFSPFAALDEPDNKHHKIAFLHQFDHKHPRHLLCFPCGKYHRRLTPGKEALKIEFFKFPVFDCPNVKNSVLPRMRITHGRYLPYYFVQLALRASRHHPSYGIDHTTLARRWKCKDSDWKHRSRFLVHDDRLLMRVVSQVYTPPAKDLTETAERHILYDREEYTPFFSVCAHWKDGDLMKICKCMMSHVPAPPDPYHKQIQRSFKLSASAARPDFIVRGCDECRPARRCPECPTEYLVEVQMIEDTNDKVNPFKHALVVTRWSDLGDGSSPYTSPEWAAIHGVNAAGYDSFSNVGRRAVGGIFESQVSGAIPGQRLISLNPSNKKSGDDGHGWY